MVIVIRFKKVSDVWDNSPVSKRKRLSKTLGYKEEWGTLRFEEIEKHGGGFLTRDLHNLWKKHKKKKAKSILKQTNPRNY